MPGRLEGNAAFVTGAASGIGRAIATMFALEGARVAVSDCDEVGGAETARLITDAGGYALFLRTDVTSEESVRGAMAAANEKLRAVDILVNDAGIVHMAAAANTALQDWERVLAVNLRGVFLCSKHAIPPMRSNGGGSIVNIASIGSLVSVPLHAAYNASKAGVLGLSRQMAADYGPDNIRVNCVCPTGTDTPMVRGAGATTKALEVFAQQHPLKRLPEPEDIAHAVLFLASDEARCITGVALPVDAGYTAV